MKKKRYLNNPLHEDFTVTYDTNGDGNPLPYTLRADEMEAFEDPVYEHIKKHLAYKVAQELFRDKGTFEDAEKKALKLIEVNLDE